MYRNRTDLKRAAIDMKDNGNTIGLDKRKLIDSFNAAARGYATVSAMQKYVGEELVERLGWMKISPRTILDLGSGPGVLSRALARKFCRAHIVQMDIAENMLRTSRQSATRLFSKQVYVCADAESIPLAGQTTDFVFSNLMLQWCHEPDRLFDDLARILRPGGLFVFSSLGPDTLTELRESWAAVDELAHVNTFIDMHDLGDALVRAGFTDPVMEVDFLTLTYNDVSGLMKDLKGLGAHNVNTGRRKSLTGKKRFIRMQYEYEKRKRNDRIPATYEVIYGHAWAPETNVRKRRLPGEAVISVEDLKRTLRKSP